MAGDFEDQPHVIQALPILAGMLLLVGLVMSLLPREFSGALFTGNPWWDALEGAVLGAVATGPPVVSHILGKGLLDTGVSLVAVTALILSWVTVGIVQLPAEMTICMILAGLVERLDHGSILVTLLHKEPVFIRRTMK